MNFRPFKRVWRWESPRQTRTFRSWLFYTWRVHPYNQSGQVVLGSNKAKTGWRFLGFVCDYEGGT